MSTGSSADVSVSSSGTSATLRQLNSSTVLDAVKRSGHALRVAEIVGITGLSRPTVETVVECLLLQGFVTIVEPDEAEAGRRPGRPARTYRFNGAIGHVIGVDIGAHSVAGLLSDLSGATIVSTRRRIDPATPGERRLEVTCDVIATLLAESRVSADNVLAVTLGTPGTVSPRVAEINRVGNAPGMRDWADVDLVAPLRERFACQIDLENDANLAAVGERARGVASGAGDMLFLMLGERLGAGVITNGQLVRGRDGASGELGYISVRGARHRAPEYGPLESQVNASAIADLGRRMLMQEPDSGLARLCNRDPGRLTAEMVALAARQADPIALRVLAKIVRVLSQGVAPALLTLNPELVVIGGAVSRAGSVLRDMLAAELDELVLYPPDVCISGLGDEAVLAGAVVQSITVVEKNVLSRVSA